MKVAFATMEKIENRPLNAVGSSRIRARWLINYWPHAEEYKVGKPYDVMIFQKAYWKEMLEQFDGIKIFDICDPDWLEPRPVIESVDLCDACVTSTEALAEYIRKFTNKPVICIPDRVDFRLHDPRGKHEGRAEKIGWFGYSQNQHYLNQTLDFLIEKNLELVSISNAPLSLPYGYEGRVKVTNIHYNFETVNEELKKCDMALLPETGQDLKGKFKSNNKLTTAWALGLPVVQTADDLDRFMDAEERNKEMSEKLAFARENYDVRLSVKEYQNLIIRIQAEKAKLKTNSTLSSSRGDGTQAQKEGGDPE